MALSRQGLPMWTPAAVPEDCIHRGAYVLRHSYKEGEPDLILIGTGSEVHVCTAAADLLEADGIATRVVSAPCLDRFAEQDQEYRDTVLPPKCRARVGEDGEAIGMTTFGASAPHTALYEHFGFTPGRVAERGKAVVERVTTRSG
jgi:transketolase